MAGHRKEDDGLVCSVCGCGFFPEHEGGMAGDFGIIPVAFCPTCYNGVIDMVHQMFPCPTCGELYEDAYDTEDDDD